MVDFNPVIYKEFNRSREGLRKVPVYNSKTNFEPKADVFTRAKDFVKNNPKKVIAYSLIAAGIVAGIAALVKKGKPFSINLEGKRILSKADKITKEADTIAQNAQKEYDSAMALIREGELQGFQDVLDKNGSVVREFLSSDNASLIMREMSGNKITRETIYNPETSRIELISKNVKHISDDITKAKESYTFSEGEFISYFKNAATNETSDEIKVGKIFDFRAGKLFFYSENNVIDDKKGQFSQRCTFIDDKLRKYESGVKLSDTIASTKKQFFFTEDSKVEEYKKGIKIRYIPEPDERIMGRKIEKANQHYLSDETGKLVKQEY